MKVFVPNYYKNFSCIANKCKHSCCIGWEIDIDNESLEKYKNINSDFGKLLNNNIAFNGECASFILDKNERCPFLNNRNLCDIILNLGEDSLCQICSDHPRFRNYFSDRVEIGLGLCCEEVARIIVSQKEHFTLIEASDDGDSDSLFNDETLFFKLRNDIFEMIQKSKSSEQLVEEFFKKIGTKIPDKSLKEWADVYLKLERLDKNWEVLLKSLNSHKALDFSIPPQHENSFKNILTYFIYRHLSDSIDNGNYVERLLFAILSCGIIFALVKKGNNLEDVVRMYSSEIEYSDENINTLIELLEKESLEA